MLSSKIAHTKPPVTCFEKPPPLRRNAGQAVLSTKMIEIEWIAFQNCVIVFLTEQFGDDMPNAAQSICLTGKISDRRKQP